MMLPLCVQYYETGNLEIDSVSMGSKMILAQIEEIAKRFRAMLIGIDTNFLM